MGLFVWNARHHIQVQNSCDETATTTRGEQGDDDQAGGCEAGKGGGESGKGEGEGEADGGFSWQRQIAQDVCASILLKERVNRQHDTTKKKTVQHPQP